MSSSEEQRDSMKRKNWEQLCRRGRGAPVRFGPYKNEGQVAITTLYGIHMAKKPSEDYSEFLRQHNIIDVVAGDQHTVAVDKNGRVFWWGLIYNGFNRFEQLYFTPKRVRFDSFDKTCIVKVWSGGKTNYALDTDGIIWCWGPTQFSRGWLGGLITQKLFDTKNYPVKELYVRDRFTLAILENGNVIGWGENVDGILGSNEPKQFEGFIHRDYARNLLYYELGICTESLSVGASHAAAKMHDGTILVWGRAKEGQFASSVEQETHCVKNPTKLILPEECDCSKVFCVGNSTFILTKYGVYATGDNSQGQLGINLTVSQVHQFTRLRLDSVDKIFGNEYMTAFLSIRRNSFHIAGKEPLHEQVYRMPENCLKQYFEERPSHRMIYPDKIIFRKDFSILFLRTPDDGDKIVSGDSFDVEKIMEQTRRFLSS